MPFVASVIELWGTRIYARHCEPCVEAHRLSCQPKQEIRDLREDLWASLCPREYRLITESEGGTELAKLLSGCPGAEKALAWRYGQRGLLMGGPTGTGKTRSAWRLLRRCFDEGRTVKAMTAGEFGRSYADAGGSHTLNDWFSNLATVNVLFIDEIGNAAWTDGAEAVFFDLLEKRGVEGRPMITASNHKSESLASKLRDQTRAAPMIRRLKTYCEFIPMGK